MRNYMINTIVFDLDGTLVDSQLDFDQMRLDIGIPNGAPILEYLEEIKDLNFKKNAYKIIHEHELKGAEVAAPLSDADSFIQSLNQKCFPISILTRNSQEVTLKTLQKFNWKFHSIHSRDTAPPKPKPDAIHRISEELKIDLKNILYIGDNNFDLETARNAKCIAGLFLNDHNSHLIGDADISITKYQDLFKFLSV
jgi:HAD superfamily hydrolase (TIGR01549 family)